MSASPCLRKPPSTTQQEIDVARAERAKKRAEERLAAAANDPDIDWGRAAIALQRSLIRIQVARRQHSVAVPGE